MCWNLLPVPEVLLKADSVTDFKNMFQGTYKDTWLTLTETVLLSILSPTLKMVLFAEAFLEGSLLKLQTSHRRVTDKYRRVTDNCRRLKTSDRRLQMKHKRRRADFRRVTDESHTTTDESILKFFEYIYKTLFPERIWFSKCSYEKVVFT